MNQFPWQLTLGIFLGTLPLLGTIVWTLLQNDKRFTRLESQIDKLIEIVSDVKERLAKVEGRVARLDEKVTELQDRGRSHIIKG